MSEEDGSRHDQDDDKAEPPLTQAQKRRIEAYENQCRLRAWEIGVPAFAVLACIICLYTCEDCLLGVMLFCAVLCFKDWILVLVFITSLVLYASRHPIAPATMHHITNAAFEFIKTE